jgi:hypothetical protein
VIRNSSFYILEFKRTILARHDAAAIARDSALQNDISAGNRVVVHIGYSTDNLSSLRLRGTNILREQRNGGKQFKSHKGE